MGTVSMKKVLGVLFSVVLVLGLAPSTLYAQTPSDDGAQSSDITTSDKDGVATLSTDDFSITITDVDGDYEGDWSITADNDNNSDLFKEASTSKAFEKLKGNEDDSFLFNVSLKDGDGNDVSDTFTGAITAKIEYNAAAYTLISLNSDGKWAEIKDTTATNDDNGKQDTLTFTSEDSSAFMVVAEDDEDATEQDGEEGRDAADDESAADDKADDETTKDKAKSTTNEDSKDVESQDDAKDTESSDSSAKLLKNDVKSLADEDVASVNGQGYDSLSAAFNAAAAGDTIMLEADLTVDGTATYLTVSKGVTIDMNGHNIDVTANSNYVFYITTDDPFALINSQSEGGIIDGDPESTGTGSTKTAVRSQDSTSSGKDITLENITIQNFGTYAIYTRGPAIADLLGGSLSVDNCTITDNTYDSYGGGIRAHFLESVNITDSIISDNSSTMSGGGVYIQSSSNIVINNNTFDGNIVNAGSSSYWLGGGGFCLENPIGDIEIKDNTITNNIGEYLGGGFTVYFNSNGGSSIRGEMGDVLIEDNTVTGNRVRPGNGTNEARGGGIAVIDTEYSHENTVTATFIGNKIDENAAGTEGATNNIWNRGGGIALCGYSDDLEIDIVSGEILNNTASWGGGIDYTFKETSKLRMYSSVITNNSALRGGGVWLCPTSVTDMNETFGGAIYNNTATGSMTWGGQTVNASGDDIRYESSDSDIYDLLNTDYGTVETSYATVMARALGGELIDWYRDDVGARYQQGDKTVDVTTDYYQTKKSFGLHAELNDQGQALANAEATLTIAGNEATMFGGGIASNAVVTFGVDDEDELVKVEKQWLDEDDKELSSDALPDYVDVTLVRIDKDHSNAEEELETVRLTADNDWSYTFDYLEHQYITVDGEDVSYHDYLYSVKEVDVDGVPMADSDFTYKVTSSDPVLEEIPIGDDGNTLSLYTVSVALANTLANPDKDNPDKDNPDKGTPEKGNPDKGSPDKSSPDADNPASGGKYTSDAGAGTAKTGDTTPFIAFIVLAVVAATIAAVAGRRAYRNRHHGNHLS